MNINISREWGKCQKCEETKEEIAFWQKVKEGMPYVADSVYITTAGHKGFGVFAKKNINKGEVIEYCHCMTLSLLSKDNKDYKIRQYAYTSRIGDSLVDELNLIPFGFGEIYNTSENKAGANAVYKVYSEQNLIVFRAIKDIPKDDEVLVWWGESYYLNYIKNKKNEYNR